MSFIFIETGNSTGLNEAKMLEHTSNYCMLMFESVCMHKGKNRCANTCGKIRHQAVKCVNTELWKCKFIMLVYHYVYTPVCVRACISLTAPWSGPWAHSFAVSMCLSAADRQIMLVKQVEAVAMRSSDQTSDRHDTRR